MKDFYVRDDVSRITAGKKETVTKSKVKEQKRFLLDSMKNLHSKFKAEHNLVHISYSWFSRLRPFYVVIAGVSDRETCLCKTCDNAELIPDSKKTLD